MDRQTDRGWMDGQRKWHIEVGAPPKTGLNFVILLLLLFSYNMNKLNQEFVN